MIFNPNKFVLLNSDNRQVYSRHVSSAVTRVHDSEFRVSEDGSVFTLPGKTYMDLHQGGVKRSPDKNTILISARKSMPGHTVVVSQDQPNTPIINGKKITLPLSLKATDYTFLKDGSVVFSGVVGICRYTSAGELMWMELSLGGNTSVVPVQNGKLLAVMTGNGIVNWHDVASGKKYSAVMLTWIRRNGFSGCLKDFSIILLKGKVW